MSPPRASGKDRRRALPAKIMSSPQKMDYEWCDWLVDYVPKPIKSTVRKAFSSARNSILGLYDSAKKTLKDIVEKETEQKDIDLTALEHERTLKGAYRSFVIPGGPKKDIDRF